MKKQIFSLIAFAAGITAAYAQCGSSVMRTWDGGGADEDFFNPLNWSANTVPDCNDNIAFNNTSQKNCIIPDSFITSGNIDVSNDYKGRITVSGTGTVISAASFTLNGTVVNFNAEVGHCTFASVTVGNNGMLNFGNRAGTSITTLLTLNAGGFVAFRANSTVNLNVVLLNAFGQIKCPENGTVNLTGNFSKAKIATFDHRFSTWNVRGSALQAITASNGGSGLTAVNGAINFWNVNLNKTNSVSANNDNWSISDVTDTVVIENKLRLLAGDLIGHPTGGFMFHDTLEALGEGAQGHSGTLYCGGNKTADLFTNNNLTRGGFNLTVLKEGNGSVLNIRKGTDTEVRMPAAAIQAVRGTIAFPDDVTVNIPNRNFSIEANATLTMPATATVKMDATSMTISGSVIANQSTLEFMGSNNIGVSFGGGKRRAFHDIVLNTATSGAAVIMGSNDTLESMNDFTIKAGMVTAGIVSSDAAAVFVNGDLDVQASSAANGYTFGQTIILGGNGNSAYRGNTLLSSGTVVIHKNSASDVVTASSSGNTVFVGASSASNAGVVVRKGILAFEDKDAVVATRAFANRTFVIGIEGQVVAPATDTLDIRGSLNFAHRNALKPQSGTVRLGTTSNEYNFNGTSVTFNHLLLSGAGTKTFISTDSIIVKGTMKFINHTVVFNGNLVLEGDLISNNTTNNGTIRMTTIKAAGSNNQTISLNTDGQIQDEGLSVDKSAGAVTLEKGLRLNMLRMTSGRLILRAGLSMFGANSIFGGNINSFIEGTVSIITSGAWSGNRFFIPVGRGNKYRPVQLHMSGSPGDVWDITYMDSDTVSDLGTAGSHGFDAISRSEYWIIGRSSGANGAFVELSTLGKDASWKDADIRVAAWNPSGSNWGSWGRSAGSGSNSVLSSTSGFSSNGRGLFTLAVDSTPAPIALRSEGISGNELDLVKNTANDNSQAAAQAAISFNVFPNPVAETLNIALSGAEKGSITLSDLSGKVLGVYSADTQSIDMSRFAAGVYFATFSNGSQRITQRVIRN